MIKDKNIYFFDMDGTIVKYDRPIYIRTDGNPWYHNIRGQHYFAQCQPYPKMVDLVQHLIDTNQEVYIITSVGVPLGQDINDYNEHVLDKCEWVRRHIDIPSNRILICNSRQPIVGGHTKSALASYILNRPLTSRDILVDDFNANLDDWSRAGGNAIKALNRENSVRFGMWHVDVHFDVEQNMCVFDNLIHKNSVT